MSIAKTTPRIICSDPHMAAQLCQWLDTRDAHCEVINCAQDCSQAPLCQWLDPSPVGPNGQIHSALQDAVSTLERTRHSFKSRELADLRKRLERLLEELSDN